MFASPVRFYSLSAFVPPDDSLIQIWKMRKEGRRNPIFAKTDKVVGWLGY
jgi:hypothetical protein